MNRKFKTKKSLLISLLFVACAFVSVFSPIILKAQMTQTETDKTPTCKITVGERIYNLRPNAGGYFQRVTGVQTHATVPIELSYPEAAGGDSVTLVVLDGGNINDGKFMEVVTLTKEGKLAFDLHVTSNLGLFRVLIAKGIDEKIVQVWVDAHSQAHTLDEDCDECGNKKDHCNCKKGDFDPFDGNVMRDIPNLEIWNGVGEIPLVLRHLYSSRRVVRPWQINFHYLIFDAGVNTSGQAQIEVFYPNGVSNMFTQSSTEPNKWVSLPGVDLRIFQYGSDFFMQFSTGHQYRYEKVIQAGVTHFFLRDFKDQYQNLYTVTYDIVNLKKRITEPGGRYIELTFSPRTMIEDPLSATTSDGRSVQYKYDTVNQGIWSQIRLRKVLYGDGTEANYDYSRIALGYPFVLAHAVDPRNPDEYTNLKFTYNANRGIVGMVQQELNGLTNEVMHTLDMSSEDRKVLSANGRLQIFNMPENQLGRINKYTDGVGAETKYTYDDGGIGFMKTEIDALGRTTTYNSRTIYGNLLEVTYPDGSKEKWTRDSLDQILAYTDRLSRITLYTRDFRHRPTKITYPDGSFETFTYNSFSQVLNHIKQNGCAEHFTYDSRGLKTSFTDCGGNVTTYSYDFADRLAMVTDARGNTTKYQYNERGLITKITNADNSTKNYMYDAFGNNIIDSNELGNKWMTTYDEFRRPKTKTDPLGRTTTYSYDLPGICGCAHADENPTKITLPSGKMTTIAYDVEGRKISVTVGAGTTDGATTYYHYDLVGNRFEVVDPRSKVWKYEYDVRNRTIAFIDPLGSRTTYTYDTEDNLLTRKRPDGGSFSYVYDVMNQKIKITDPKGQVTMMLYDVAGNMITLIDPKTNAYNFNYDVLDRRIKMIYPNASFEQYGYDAIGNLVTYKNRNGDIQSFFYDNRNRDTLSDWSDATPDIYQKYDAASRLTRIASSISTLTYTYNDADEMLNETQDIAEAGGPKTIAYTYNVDALRSTMTYPGGTTVAYDYTGRNQIFSITTGVAPPLTTYTYDLNGNRKAKNLTNGTNTLYDYDDVNHLTARDNRKGAASFAKYNYAYDNVDRRKYVQFDNAKGDVYGYDAVDQLVDVKYDVTNPDGTPSMAARTVNSTYDSSGNRSILIDNGTPTNYISNNLNQYTNVGGIVPTYTMNGSLQGFDGWTYTYDAQNRLTKAQKGAAIAEFSYDGLNRCVKRIISGTTTYYYFDHWNLIEERDVADINLAYYVHGVMSDEILAKVSTGITVYYHHDALGNVTQLTNTNGDVVEKYTYDVFGLPTFRNNSNVVITGSAFANRFLFTGREYIREIELYDLRNRVYSSKLGRFLQTDPLRIESDDINLYRYVKNKVTNKVDPFGLFTIPPDQGDSEDPNKPEFPGGTENFPDGDAHPKGRIADWDHDVEQYFDMIGACKCKYKIKSESVLYKGKLWNTAIEISRGKRWCDVGEGADCQFVCDKSRKGKKREISRLWGLSLKEWMKLGMEIVKTLLK